MMVIVIGAALGACGDNVVADDVPGDDTGPSPWDRVVVHSGPLPVLAAEVLADGRVAVFEAESPPDDAPRCPDCEEMMIPDEECPSVCARAALSLEWIEADGTVGDRIPIDRFAIGPSAELIGSAAAVERDDGAIDLAWTRCLGAPEHACSTYRGRLDASGVLTPLGDPVLGPRVGSVTLVRDRDGSESLIRGWPDPYPFSLPIRVEVITNDGTPDLVGSSQAIMPSPSVSDRGAYLFVEDRSPGIVEAACPPCPSFVDCAIGAWPPAGNDCVVGALQQGGLGQIELGRGAASSTPVVSLPRGDGVVLKVEQLTAASGAWPTAVIDVEERGIVVAQERDDGWHTWDHAADPRFWFSSRGTGWVGLGGSVTVPGFEFPQPFPAGFEYAAPMVQIRRYDEDADSIEYQAAVHLGPVMGQSPVHPTANGQLATVVILVEKSGRSEGYDRWVVWRLVRRNTP
jgi:hypothetical protein